MLSSFVEIKVELHGRLERGWYSDMKKKKYGVLNHNHYMEIRQWLIRMKRMIFFIPFSSDVFS
jgi:N-acetyl-gamma-glutamylphosphate reductase